MQKTQAVGCQPGIYDLYSRSIDNKLRPGCKIKKGSGLTVHLPDLICFAMLMVLRALWHWIEHTFVSTLV